MAWVRTCFSSRTDGPILAFSCDVIMLYNLVSAAVWGIDQRGGEAEKRQGDLLMKEAAEMPVPMWACGALWLPW